jgi:uncharacterized damage-inducible protein DinB
MRQMSKHLLLFALCFAVAALSASLAFAHSGAPAALPVTAQAPAPAAPTSGFRAEFLGELNGLETRFMRLAEAVPAAKYTWRPGDGVRSVSEVYMHVAAANFNLTRLIGTPPPAGFTPRGFDTSTSDKAKVIDTLKQSFAHMRQAVLTLPDTDLEKEVKLPWGPSTSRGAMLFILRHMGEHMGQSIAYARSVGVVPPWTEEQQQPPAKQPEKPKQ